MGIIDNIEIKNLQIELDRLNDNLFSIIEVKESFEQSDIFNKNNKVYKSLNNRYDSIQKRIDEISDVIKSYKRPIIKDEKKDDFQEGGFFS